MRRSTRSLVTTCLVAVAMSVAGCPDHKEKPKPNTTYAHMANVGTEVRAEESGEDGSAAAR